MQSTTRFHDGIANPLLQEAASVCHDPVAFHPTNGVFNPNADRGNTTIGCLLKRGEFPATRGFLGLEDGNARQVKSLETLLLIPATAGWHGIACQLGPALIRGLPFTRIAQEAQVTGLVDHEEVFARVAFLLPTVILLRRPRVFRTLDGSC